MHVKRWKMLAVGIVYVSSSFWWGPAAEGAFHLEHSYEVQRGAPALVDVIGLKTQPAPYLPAPARPKPVPVARPAPASGRVNWDALARCESSGNWGESSGYYEGGVQMSPENWQHHKPAGAPAHAYQATKAQQIHAAEGVLAEEGRGAWPPLQRAECN